jgi:outer membrane receptor protein involved in Fe transport
MQTERLVQTSPGTVPDALLRLPQFAQNPSQRRTDNAGSNPTAATLSLRNFGANRNLILLDGSRIPPTTAGGAVDTNLIPQALIERVEVVTGGASAVYGSDAITGVINFVINKNFNGLRANSQFGISEYGDNATWRAGVSGGRPVLGGRGHVMGSFEHYNSAGIPDLYDRPLSRTDPTSVGAGTAASPTRIVDNGRILTGAPGSVIVGTNLPVGLRDITFKVDGVPSLFTHGLATGTSGVESGGDGGLYNQSSISGSLRTNQAFGRFDFDVTDDIEYYAQLSYTNASAFWQFAPFFVFSPSATILTGNPYIPASIQAIMTANNVQSFQLNHLEGHDSRFKGLATDTYSTNIYAKTGFSGSLPAGFTWDANYSYARSVERVYNRNNVSSEKLAAAQDAVINPANGQIVCQISLTAFASRFPGCQPLNLFGPTAVSVGAHDFITDDTRYSLANVMHVWDFSVVGSPFSLWAGPVQAAISGEYRRSTLNNVSNAEPAQPPNCTGIRPTPTCTPTTPLYLNNSTASMRAGNNVKEIAGELLIPLLRDVPFFQSLDINVAGRLTDYSTSGRVETWKLGGSWEVSEELRIRGTRSRDIRAPTLNDLFRPTSQSIAGFNDLHTGITANLISRSQGNPNLVPEFGITNTVGIVYQPNWLPRFSISLDYYEITMKNAISNVGTGAQFQRECELSNGTSIYCAQLQRPLPFSDRSPANYPTLGFSQAINATKQWTRGWDFETNYRFDLADVASSLPGTLGVRVLGSYQPLLKTLTVTTIAPGESAGLSGQSKLRINTSLNYTYGGLSVNANVRWQSHQFPSNPRTNVDLRPIIPAYTYVDTSASYRFTVRGHELTASVTVENLFDKDPPLSGYGGSVPGLRYPVYGGFDVVGRSYTFGLRARY